MAQLLKLRPVLKNEEELEEERNLIFDLPRKKCEEMAPEVLRLNQKKEENPKVIQHRYHILKRILKRARYESVDTNIVPYLQDLDRSDKVVPNGEVSKRIYMDVFHSRNFDLYGNLRKGVKHPPRKYLELKALAELKNIEYTQEMDETKIEVEKISEEEEELLKRRKNIPKLTTDKWKISRVEIDYAPVGFANNPSQPFHSYGNEYFFSYDGNWLHGKMEGSGTYLYADDTTYVGHFHNNRPHGNGESRFKHGQHYVGEYENGTFDGRGVYTTPEGIKYEGEFMNGMRSGKGKLQFPSGLEYEGDFLNGKPHGRGKMTSKLTGWCWEGQFKEGGISGHGQIIRPPPNFSRSIYYWSEKKDPISLPALVVHFLREEEDNRLRLERAKHEIHAPLRGLLLRDYVNKIRTAYQTEKRQEKQKKMIEAQEKAREQKQKLQDARLKALAGET
eukprot:gene7229-7802_t